MIELFHVCWTWSVLHCCGDPRFIFRLLPHATHILHTVNDKPVVICGLRIAGYCWGHKVRLFGHFIHVEQFRTSVANARSTLPGAVVVCTPLVGHLPELTGIFDCLRLFRFFYPPCLVCAACGVAQSAHHLSFPTLALPPRTRRNWCLPSCLPIWTSSSPMAPLSPSLTRPSLARTSAAKSSYEHSRCCLP